MKNFFTNVQLNNGNDSNGMIKEYVQINQESLDLIYS